jgi:L-histidine Nalpha-methyltransferase
MKIVTDRSTAFHGLEPSADGFFEELVLSLSQNPKSIPAKFLYDKTGSELFDQICCLDEYYPTRTEMQILRTHVAEICALFGSDCRLIELGSGSSAKTRILLDHLPDLTAYVPVDIAADHLLQSAGRLNQIYPEIYITPVCADFTSTLTLPEPPYATQRTVAFFLGSTIGNLEPAEAEEFLRTIARLCGDSGGLLIGVDLKKDRHTLERAYNDALGTTAAFNLNLLTRINRSFNAGIRCDQFRHHAFYNEELGRIEMHLVSLVDQIAQLNGTPIVFRQGEHIVTEYSYKYAASEFANLAARAGWSVKRFWDDRGRLFSVQYLEVLS